MALIDEVKTICDRLADHGWRELLLARTEGLLDIKQDSAEDLQVNLLGDIPGINRIDGLEDLHPNCRQGIQPGDPSRSLFYHAMASPKVVRDSKGHMLSKFPTETDIDTIENYVFSAAGRTLQQLVDDSGVPKLSVVVFATEYRPRPDTVSRAHADLIFSRTGIARVGTAPALYDEKVRGYWPEDSSDPHVFRVIPVRFSAWLAAPMSGQNAPVMRIGEVDAAERGRRFWRPLHKLFAGTECLIGHDLDMQGTAEFFNMKLQRVRQSLGNANVPNGAPFVMTEGLATFDEDAVRGTFAVTPTPRPRLVEPAMVDGNPLTFDVPEERAQGFATYVTPFDRLPNNIEVHRYPAYVHARTRVEDGQLFDLNSEEDVNGVVDAGGYKALHYLDFTGEGWVDVSVPALTVEPTVVDKPRAAYAILAAPDFFPSAGQRETLEWSESDRVPASLRDGELWGVPPIPLSEERLPANLQLPRNPFDKNEQTITAVVAMGDQSPVPNQTRLADVRRASTLSDDAAGVFAPGWTVSVDVKGGLPNGTPHLATYGLGSPFPEDAKLCAALSTFWPAVSPDVYRTLSLHTGNATFRGTVAPLTDTEIGQEGSLPWDGIAGPRFIEIDGTEFLEMASFLHADYVRMALENRFSIRNTAQISVEEYQRRVLVAGRIHWILSGGQSARAARPRFLFLSFQTVANGDAELERAQLDSNHILDSPVYRAETCFVGSPNGPDPTRPSPKGPAFRLLPVRGRSVFFASASDPVALRRRETDARWRPADAE